MALTVPPPTPFSEFGWIFHDNHLDSSIYQDEDIMEFSDSSADYQTPPHQATQLQQHQLEVSVCLSINQLHVYPKKTKESCDVLSSFHLMMSVSSKF